MLLEHARAQHLRTRLIAWQCMQLAAALERTATELCKSPCAAVGRVRAVYRVRAWWRWATDEAHRAEATELARTVGWEGNRHQERREVRAWAAAAREVGDMEAATAAEAVGAG